MSANAAIAWTESTWNPLAGCMKISPGRQHGRSSTSLRSRTSGRRRIGQGAGCPSPHERQRRHRMDRVDLEPTARLSGAGHLGIHCGWSSRRG
ncbi:MAG: DUF5131 family protein [Anaerolineae bacterium]|nr:MAG: DUF5131 family protein [Anaerolineae bacterium]